MSEVTRILNAIEEGDPSAAEQLLPLVYGELRKLAASRLADEAPGQTLEPTALVHEAYLRLVGVEPPKQWDSRGHFFAAAAEAMRRILVDSARRRRAVKRGHGRQRVEFSELALRPNEEAIDLVALDDALGQLEAEHPQKAQIVKLRFFAGCTLEETAKMLGISRATTERNWAFARAWLFGKLNAS